MALEAFNAEEVGGFKVAYIEELAKQFPDMVEEGVGMNWEFFEEKIRPKYPIQIRRDKNSISFTLQKGPIKEVGKNGCQIDTMIAVAREIIAGLNEQYPCEENHAVIRLLSSALERLNDRTERRKAEGIEGTSREIEGC